jgi:hypothetical protein
MINQPEEPRYRGAGDSRSRRAFKPGLQLGLVRGRIPDLRTAALLVG